MIDVFGKEVSIGDKVAMSDRHVNTSTIRTGTITEINEDIQSVRVIWDKGGKLSPFLKWKSNGYLDRFAIL